MEAAILARKGPWKSMVVELIPWNLVGDSWKNMEVPLSVGVEAFVAPIDCSFHERIPCNLCGPSIHPACIHTRTSITNVQLLPQTNPNPNLDHKLELSP